MDAKIMQEVIVTIEDIKERMKSSGKLDAVDCYFDLPNLNIIWELVAGIRRVRLLAEATCLHARVSDVLQLALGNFCVYK